jgi:hypothetical protein
MTNNPTIALFGTCGNSVWRNNFIKKYDQIGINYFNPLKEDWTPDDAIEEAKHLVTDDIILFPVTSETFGSASLAEIGFAVLSASKTKDRHIIVLIDEKVNAKLMADNPQAAKESNNSRAIVRAHVAKAKIDADYVHLVESMEDLLYLSLTTYQSLLKDNPDEA